MSEDPAYERGRVDATLSEHGTHLAKINGSIDRFADEVVKLTLEIQRLADSAEADRKTVLTTAKALKDADDARRDKGQQHWTPVQRLLAVLAGLGGLIAVIAEIAAQITAHRSWP
jgi:hypothetical protein